MIIEMEKTKLQSCMQLMKKLKPSKQGENFQCKKYLIKVYQR